MKVAALIQILEGLPPTAEFSIPSPDDLSQLAPALCVVLNRQTQEVVPLVSDPHAVATHCKAEGLELDIWFERVKS